jgi:hypothetical protein
MSLDSFQSNFLFQLGWVASEGLSQSPAPFGGMGEDRKEKIFPRFFSFSAGDPKHEATTAAIKQNWRNPFDEN